MHIYPTDRLLTICEITTIASNDLKKKGTNCIITPVKIEFSLTLHLYYI